MAAASPSFELDITKLKQFHVFHFAGQSVPNISSAQAQSSPERDQQVENEHAEEDDDSLGYYADGVKRTLTEDQIKMFRHSEIQRLLAARRREAELRDEDTSEARDREEEQNSKHPARARVADRTSMNKAKVDGVSAKSKRKSHFDEPEGDNAEVVLHY